MNTAPPAPPKNQDAASDHRGLSGSGGQTFFPNRQEKLNILVTCRGHSFSRNDFFAIFESNPGIEWSAVDHPAAQLLFRPDMASHFDCYVLYDMPGIEFKRSGDRIPVFHEPPDFYKEGLLSMMDEGFPLVVLHHACAAWPAWPTWAEIVGGQFLYHPMPSRGVMKPDSGYRLNVTHRVSPVTAHPITDGIEPFYIQDELYLSEVFEEDVVPLFASDFPFIAEHFSSARNALQGKLNNNENWVHAAGSPLVGWVKHFRNSPIVYLQFGDGPVTYANPVFRRILDKAMRWACSDEAKAWARARHLRSQA